MLRWSYQYTLNSGLIVIALLVILSSGASLFASRVLVQDMASLALGEVHAVSDGRAARVLGLQEVSSGSAALLTREAPYARAARASGVSLEASLARLKAQAVDAEARALVERVQVAEQEYREALERGTNADGSPATPVALAAAGSRGHALEQALDALVAHVEPESVGGVAATRASVERTQAVFNAITSVSIALAVILCIMLIVVINRSSREQATARQVSEDGQARTTEALHEANTASHLKDEFLATVSHELRNPLAPILTWTQLLRSGTLDPKKAERGLEVIERNVVSLSQLIDDLVDVSRVVGGKFRLDVRPLDLLPVIRASVEAVRPASEARQIRLQMVLDERAGMVSGDSERLQQVLSNLLSNAIKFTPKGGSVQVTLSRAESHIEIAVSDTGIGMDRAFLPHVFEPFQQAVDGTMRRHGGLGLGLSIVHHIVELHGGVIVAESRGPGQGSRFTIELPLLGTSATKFGARPRHPVAVEHVGDLSLMRLDHVKVLLVDDEPSANEALQELLDSCGAEVRVAGSAEQALQMLDLWKPDVLISDIAMPEEDGYVLIRKLRALSAEHGGEIPAAALTAYAKIDDRVRILAAGFQMYLSKPADPSELIAVVSSLARRRRPVVGVVDPVS